MSVTDELVRNAERYAESFDKPELPLPPAKRVAIVACMDARLNPYGLLGLNEGDAHVIRNACGGLTNDEIRTLSVSQWLPGNKEVILSHHNDRRVRSLTADASLRQIQPETGNHPDGADH